MPFRGETPISTILKHLNEPPPLEGPAAAALPEDLRPVLRRCLAKEPSGRYANSAEVADALRNARSPSRRQQPVSTAVLQADTLAASVPAPRRPARPPKEEEAIAPTIAGRPPRGRRVLQPWLLVVPLVVVGAGVVVVQQTMRRPATTPLTMAAALPAPTPPAAAAVAPATTFALPDTVPAAPRPSRTPASRPSPPPTSRPSPPVAAAARSSGPVSLPAAAPPTTVAAPPIAAPPAPAADARSTEPGLLQLAVKPWGEVTLDGRLAGTTPLDRIALSPGPHSVRVRHPLYEVWERQVTIRAGQVEKVVVDFPAQGVRKQ